MYLQAYDLKCRMNFVQKLDLICIIEIGKSHIFF